ncbi:hypothetical protein Rsub_11567 [Raphidocelis subcapitata]|uniref:Uncharacterized protein n=1 Tax=Raphidocelis subcapitata TaxID=307507 RepID=A0A2V0PGM8_9CHLO|nr:hypothetical protein Rsub_11567 [Raphidocelis subcapitata]|eukprot:GBF98981.1 hypothetical protein Rsub_11567 [Raphidocelis subcapitata]
MPPAVPSWTSGVWPYARGPTAEAQATQAATGGATAAAAAAAAAGGPAGATQRSLQAFFRSITASGLWDLAIKRNAMFTSLALLGGVLVADVMLFPGAGVRRRKPLPQQQQQQQQQQQLPQQLQQLPQPPPQQPPHVA